MGQPGQMGTAATPKCKESAYWKHKERGEYGASITNSYDFYVGYNASICPLEYHNDSNEVWRGCSQKNFYKCISHNAAQFPFARFLNCIQGRRKSLLVGGDVRLNVLNLGG